MANIINKVEKAKYRIEKQRRENENKLKTNKNENTKQTKALGPSVISKKILFKKSSELARASNFYRIALEFQENDTYFLTEYALFLFFWEQFDEAEIYFLRTLDIDPNQLEALKTYGSLLLSFHNKLGTHFLSRFGFINQQQAVLKNFLSKKIGEIEASESLKNIENGNLNILKKYQLFPLQNNFNQTL